MKNENNNQQDSEPAEKAISNPHDRLVRATMQRAGIAEAELKKRSDPKRGESMMSAAEKLIEEGRERGRQEGRQEGLSEGQRRLLRTLLQQRFGSLPMAIEKRLRGATADQLEAWANTILNAATLDDVFD